MFKRFGFYAAVLLLVMHGVTMSMMHTAKTLRTTSFLKFNKRSYSSIDSKAYVLQIAKIEARCKIVAAPGLNFHDRAYLYAIVDSMNKTEPYDLQIAKIEARCKVLAAPGLSYHDRVYLYAIVDGMHKE